MVGLVYGV